MRRSIASSLALTAALMLGASAAEAQTQNFLTCSVSGNNFQANLCFNWEFSHTSGTNTIGIKLQNVGTTTGNLNAFAIWLPSFAPAAQGTSSGATAVNTTTQNSPSTAAWSSTTIDPPLGNLTTFDFGTGTGNGNEGVCFGSPGGKCWFTGTNSYLAFTFTFASTFNTLDLTGAKAGAKWQSAGTSGNSYECGFADAGATTGAPFGLCSTTASDTPVTGQSVVPEPSTYALMIAGLAALGVAARRRRNA